MATTSPDDLACDHAGLCTVLLLPFADPLATISGSVRLTTTVVPIGRRTSFGKRDVVWGSAKVRWLYGQEVWRLAEP